MRVEAFQAPRGEAPSDVRLTNGSRPCRRLDRSTACRGRLPSLTLSFVLGMSLSSVAAPGPTHPSLFLTSADVERVRQAVRQHPAFAQFAADLARRAATERIEDLPPLEWAWWEAARQKPWSETYPEIYHHTLVVPMKWAELARACARASLLSPASETVAKAKRILLALANYTFEFEHYDVGLNYAWVIRAGGCMSRPPCCWNTKRWPAARPRICGPSRSELRTFWISSVPTPRSTPSASGGGPVSRTRMTISSWNSP